MVKRVWIWQPGDVALAQGIAIAGWVPRGGINEAGCIPAIYKNVREASTLLPAERTFLNVKQADATLVITAGKVSGGTLFTLQMADALHRPVMHLDLDVSSATRLRESLEHLLLAVKPFKLNVAGPRASENGEIYQKTVDLLMPVHLGGGQVVIVFFFATHVYQESRRDYRRTRDPFAC